MRNNYRVACSLLLVAASAAAQQASKATELDGYWKLESIEVAEKPVELPEEVIAWHIKGEKASYADAPFAALAIDSTSDPKTLDLAMLSSKKTFEGIYTIEEDVLRICVNSETDGVKERPTKLETKDHPNYRLISFKRITADERPAPKGYVGMALRLDDDKSEVVIFDIIPDSPAMKAGLKKDDVLLKVASAEVRDLQTAVRSVRQIKPGSEVRLGIRREGQEKEILLTVGAFPFELLGILG
jgi:uncharacterized protein (TIGR03067 family)